MGLAKRDPAHHTYGEYCTWPDDVRYELIDGIAYAMGPAPLRRHQRLVGEIFAQIHAALKEAPCEVNIAPFDVRLPKGQEADREVDTVVQPDIVVVCDPAKLDEKGCRGAPDWIIEVLSPSTAGHDQILKLALYERHCVRETWLVHPTDRIVTVYRLSDGAYGRATIAELTGTLASSACPEVVVDWEAVVKGLPDDRPA